MADHNTLPASTPMAVHLTTLAEINQAINASLDLDAVMDTVLDRVIEVVKAQRGFLMLRDDAGQMRVQVARGMNREDLLSPDFQYSKTIVNEVASSAAPLLTSNARYDPRFEQEQSIIALGLRSIMCVPLLARGRPIGVVYVDNPLRTGVFQQSDLDLLTSFAAIAGIALENARLHRLEVESARLERELSMAHEIQRSMLPQRLPEFPGYEIAATWHSVREVAGDFYDAFPLAGDRLGVVIADVADKGIGAALLMAVARSLIRGIAAAVPFPLDTIHQANRLMCLEGSDNGMFVTAYYTVFERGGRAVGVNAGHNRPLLYRHRTGEIIWLPRGGRAMGWFEQIPLNPYPIELAPGDVLVYYTDGLTEAENEHGLFFGQRRLAGIVREEARRGRSAQDILERIGAAVETFIGQTPPVDDLTMIVVKYTGEDR